MWILKPSVLVSLLAMYLAAGGASEAAGRYSGGHPDQCTDLRCLGLKLLQYQRVKQDQPPQTPQELIVPQLEEPEENFLAFISRGPIADLNNELKKRNRNAYDDSSNSMGLSRGYSLNNHLNRGLYSSRTGDFINVSPPICACGYTENTIDLGHLRFPRILPTLECTAGSCGVEPYSCKGKIYKVWVLKQKQPGDSEAVHGPLLPEALRASYELEMVPVTVACECTA